MTANPNQIRPAFMDTVEAAANLKTDRQTVLRLIQDGKLKSYGGKIGNPFVRTAEVDKLVEEMGLNAKPELSPMDARTVQRNDPVRKIKLRLQQDAKWNEISEADMRLWAAEIDPVTFSTMQNVATDAIAKLEMLIQIIEESLAKPK